VFDGVVVGARVDRKFVNLAKSIVAQFGPFNLTGSD
jgi:hypothetical protein